MLRTVASASLLATVGIFSCSIASAVATYDGADCPQQDDGLTMVLLTAASAASLQQASVQQSEVDELSLVQLRSKAVLRQDLALDVEKASIPLDSSAGATPSSSSLPLDVCAGDCDSDKDCAGGLTCFQRSGYTAVPGCSGQGDKDYDYCSNSATWPLLDSSAGTTPAASSLPLGKCAGDCDSDADCASGLTCFQRSGYDAVPGCAGKGTENFDFCVPPSGYDYMYQGCIANQNLELYQGKSVDECARICNGLINCIGFEYGVDYGGQGEYNAQDCQPNTGSYNAQDAQDCDGAYYNLDFYVKQPPPSGYDYMYQGCIANQNLELYQGKSVDECATICDGLTNCIGFEYGVDYGGQGEYNVWDCQPNTGSYNAQDAQDCDGAYYNLDFYVKQTPSPTPDPTPDPTAAPTSSPTSSPTSGPTSSPTSSPTSGPTSSPTPSPTSAPTGSPTESPTESPTGCVYTQGDGTCSDGTCEEVSVGDADTKEECASKVKLFSAECNGATYSNNGGTECYCEKGMTEQIHTRAQWQTCFLPSASSGYDYIYQGCIANQNLELYQGKSVDECATICDGLINCIGFEYGVDYGGQGEYNAQDCQPNTGSYNAQEAQDCDGAYYNLDFYVKQA